MLCTGSRDSLLWGDFMWYLKKIIAWLLVFAILIFSLCVPAFASDPAPTDSRGDFYDWVINSGALDANRPGGPFGPGSGGGGRFSKEHYDEWVSELPALGYNSAGHLIWQVAFSDVDANSPLLEGTRLSSFPCDNSNWNVSFLSSGRGLHVVVKCSSTNWDLLFYPTVLFPISGNYRLLLNLSHEYSLVSPAGVIEYGTAFYDASDFVYHSIHRKNTSTMIQMMMPAAKSKRKTCHMEKVKPYRVNSMENSSTTSFADYTVTEALLLFLLLAAFIAACARMLRGGLLWLRS